jgi:molecular chaperone DnaK
MAKRALVIANSQYDDARFSALPAAKADAVALADVLSDPAIGEFTVEELVNIGQRDATRAIQAFFAGAQREDLLLLHLSLHGWKDLHNMLYFVASDTERDFLEATAISADFVSERMSRSRSGRIILMLDCCYSGAFTAGMLRRSIDPPRVDVAEPFAGKGRMVVTASTSLQFAYEGEPDVRLSQDQAQPSLFTAAVVQGLADGSADLDGDGLISVTELYEYVHERVRRKVPEQTPTLSVDSVQGTIFLARNPHFIDGLPGSTHEPAGETELASQEPFKLPSNTQKRPQAPLSWHDAIDNSQTVTIEGLTTPSEISKAAGVVSVVALLGWTAFAAFLAYSDAQHWWLGIAAAVGFFSFLLLKHDDFEFGGLLLAIITFPLYLVSSFSANGWLFRSFTIGIMILFPIVAFGQWIRMLSVSSAKRSFTEYSFQRPIIKAIERSRWLFGNAADHPESALLNQLGRIPAARFASVPTGHFRLAVVAGKRVVLVAFANWPPGEYTRLNSAPYDIRRDGQLSLSATDEFTEILTGIKKWRSELPDMIIRFIVMVGPANPPEEMKLNLNDESKDLVFATRSSFARIAGEFLVNDAYELNVPVLERVLWHISPQSRPPTWWYHNF